MNDREFVSFLLVVLLFSFNGYSLFLLLPKALGLNYSWLWMAVPLSILGALLVSFVFLFAGKYWMNPSAKILRWRIYRARAGKLLALLYILATLFVLAYLLLKVRD